MSEKKSDGKPEQEIKVDDKDGVKSPPQLDDELDLKKEEKTLSRNKTAEDPPVGGDKPNDLQNQDEENK